MLPIRLKLYNFLPYRSPDAIRFEGIELACLTGHNGAGKSSLLDAITWALWGKARATRDDDLVHQGQPEMFVELDFEQEGSLYRVLRKRKAGRRGQGSLDLFIVDDEGGLRTINEPSMRQTQTRINEILRLDYETFINSAFLQQGKADAFTVKRPAERKKILSDILGLEQWSVYEDRVKKTIKGIDRSLSSIEGSLNEIENELRKEPQYQEALTAAQKAYDIAEETLNDAITRLGEVESAPADLRNAQEQETQLLRRLQNYRNDLNTLQTEIERRRKTVQAFEDMINRAETIESGYQNLQDAREADSSLGGKLREIRDLEKREKALDKQLRQAQAALENEKSGHEATIREVERLLQTDISDELAEVQSQIAALEQLEQERNNLNDLINDLREESSGYGTEQKALAAEGKKMNERIARLEEAEGATCPLCGQPLDDEHRQSILDELNTERDDKRQMYAAATERVTEIKAEIKERQAESKLMAERLADLPRLRSQAGAMQQQHEEANRAQTRLAEAQVQLDAVMTALETDDYGHELWAQLRDLHKERDEIGYDEAQHDDIQAQLDEYRNYEQQFTELQVARAGLEGERDALESVEKRHDKTTEALAEEETSHAALQETIKQFKLQVEIFYQRQQEVAQRRTEEARARDQVTSARQQLDSLEHMRQRKSALESDREALEIEQGVYKELQLAFGKNGIPAMIIESAVPELETTANELLSRMTNGRMNLKISTQREKISGGTMETLDIEISDELGTRNYEMYSGGEAFRINFAVRIALSQMLARRAGAHLRTLFIDEGFGTQDDDGRSKLIEALQLIKNEFDMILVITHLEELRDAFPVHLVVDKTASGSRIAIR